MEAIFRILNQNKLYYGLNLFVVLMAIILLSTFSKSDGFMWLNQFHSPVLNTIFESVTFLGDGLFVIVCSFLIFVFFKHHRKLAFIILMSYVSSGLFAQLIKSIIIAPRPSVYFEMYHYQFYLDTFATSRIGFSSFPSGHTASFFALATVLSAYCKRRYVCMAVMVMSVLVGYSRIYLAHHFLIDVFVGSLIGVVFGLLSIIWVDRLMVISKFRFLDCNNQNIFNSSLSK